MADSAGLPGRPPSMTRRAEVGLLAAVLVLSLAPRLYRINTPFLDTWWQRELLCRAVAANYYAKGIDLLWPETDFTPDRPNYMGMELPLSPALAALGWRIFGVHDWVPRAISVFWSLASIVLLYLLLRHFLSAEGAFAGTLLFALSPLNAFVSRKLVNEPLTLCCALLCMWLFVRWVGHGKATYLLAAAVAGAVAGLSKPPVVHFVLPLAWYLWHRKGGVGLRDWRVCLFGVAVLGPIPFYMKHLATIRATYWGVGTHLESGMWFSPAQFASLSVWSLFADRFIREILTPVGIVGVAVGVAFLRPKRREWFLAAWLIAVVVCFLAILGGNARQAYYQIWFVAPCAGITGYAWEVMRRHLPPSRSLAPGLIAMLLVCGAWGIHPLFDRERSVLKAAQALDTVDPGRSWIIVYPAGYNCLCYLNRQGWCGRDVAFPHPWEAPGNPEYIRERTRRGARFCVIFTRGAIAAPRDLAIEGYLEREAARVYHDPDFDIYRLTTRVPPGNPSSPEALTPPTSRPRGQRAR